MNDYIQYVTSDFLAGLGFGATQMLGENEGIWYDHLEICWAYMKNFYHQASVI